ncbi:hypothetical protein [Mycolicibacterium murale]|nr:hypothetical protein [Mycolicibacterium murale]MCV7181719.1 hypothetical protein [Mycolicibacterium murale]
MLRLSNLGDNAQIIYATSEDPEVLGEMLADLKFHSIATSGEHLLDLQDPDVGDYGDDSPIDLLRDHAVSVVGSIDSLEGEVFTSLLLDFSDPPTIVGVDPVPSSVSWDQEDTFGGGAVMGSVRIVAELALIRARSQGTEQEPGDPNGASVDHAPNQLALDDRDLPRDDNEHQQLEPLEGNEEAPATNEVIRLNVTFIYNALVDGNSVESFDLTSIEID